MTRNERLSRGAITVLVLACIAGPSIAAQTRIEEVVVTAQKREQSLGEVSVAITVFTGDQLESLGFLQPIDVQAQVPNFHIKNEIGKATPTLTIRGVGIGAFSHNAVSPVGMYVDELFLPSTAQMSFILFDLERVEVLKGPQGTHFGRNTTAGAVSFVSRKPTEEFEAAAKFGVGSFSSTRLEAHASGPISENLSARLAATHVGQGQGFYYNRLSGEHIGETGIAAMRGSVLWDVSDTATLWLQAHFGREDSDNYPWVAIGTADPDQPVSNPHFPGGRIFTTDCAPLATTPTRFFRDNCVTRNGYRDPDQDMFDGDWSLPSALEIDASGALARLDIELGATMLTSVTGFNSLDKTAEEDFDGSPFALGDNTYGTEVRVFSQEVRLASNAATGGRLEWMAGAVYYREEQEQRDRYGYADRANHDIGVHYTQQTRSLGIFGHTEVRLADAWSLIAGARYTRDSIAFAGETTIENIEPGGPQPVFGPFTFASLFGEYGTLTNPDAISAIDDTLDSAEVTYEAGLDYWPREDLLLYASFSRGYKSGGFVGFWTTSSMEWGPFGAEFVDAVEVGFKGRLADGAASLNGAVFGYDYEDAQIFGLTPTGAFTILNAGEGDFLGGELELQWAASQSLDIIAGLGYIDAELVIGDGAPVRPGNTPELSFNGIVRYETHAANNLRLVLQTDFSRQDEVYFDATERLAVGQPAYWLVNARASLSNQQGAWEVAAWVRNLADERYFGQIFRSATAAALSAIAGNPRTYGIEVTLRL